MPKYVGGYATRQCKSNPIAEGFAKGISNGLEAFAQGLAERQRKQQDEEIIGQMNNPELSEMERAQLAMKLSPQGQKTVMTTLELYRKLADQQARQRQHDEEQQYKSSRESRLKEEHDTKDIERMYKSRLSTIKDQLKDARSSERKPLQDEQKALQQELGQNIARVKRGENPRFEVLQIEEEPLPVNRGQFDSVNQMGGAPNVPGATAPIRENTPAPTTSFTTSGPQNTVKNATALKQRQRWNPQDPAHQSRALEILDAAKGDRAAANQALAEEFER